MDDYFSIDSFPAHDFIREIYKKVDWKENCDP